MEPHCAAPGPTDPVVELMTETPAIIGMGVVGTAMAKLLGPHVAYDVRIHTEKQKERINRCPIAFVAVPTPMGPDGRCQTHIVEEVVAWCECPIIVLRSTVSPGTTDRLRERYGKRIVFQPEYLGETTAHVFSQMDSRNFVVLGGAAEDTSAVADFYKRYYNSYVRYYFSDALTAELAKYMENSFYAAKVLFVNEFYDIARTFGVDFNQLRELWLADTRISPDHTFVYPHRRGFDGKCLPKDVSAIVTSTEERGYSPELLRAVLAINDRIRAGSPPVAPWLTERPESVILEIKDMAPVSD